MWHDPGTNDLFIIMGIPATTEFKSNLRGSLQLLVIKNRIKTAKKPKRIKFKFTQNIYMRKLKQAAIFKTRIRRMRTRIQRIRRTWGTRRIQWIWRIQRTRQIWRIQRIWWIWRIQRIRRIPYAIFKRFFSFIYSATKGFISSSKLSSELYLAEGWTTNK